MVKINHVRRFPGIFEKEVQGLEALRQSNSFRIPEVYAYGEIEDSAYLLLENIESGARNEKFWNRFAESLAKLHHTTTENYGFEDDNYIGSLPQYNRNAAQTLSGFYIQNRLEPQFERARDNGFTFSSQDRLYQSIREQFPEEPPILIHGDLWNGNYLVGKKGEPVLIDPAVSYVSREMDLAMMHLFGGFSPRVYDLYQQIYPLKPDWESRIELWQLYYLLVHLNLFGSSYLSGVTRIIKKHS